MPGPPVVLQVELDAQPFVIRPPQLHFSTKEVPKLLHDDAPVASNHGARDVP